MKKNFLQDVVPANNKRSIRDIPLPRNRKENRGDVVKSKPVSNSPVIASYKEDVENSYVHTKTSPSKTVFDAEKLHHKEASHVTEDPYFKDVPHDTFNGRNVEKLTQVKKNRGPKTKIVFALVGVAAFVILFFIFGRSNATITLHAKQSTHTISNTITLDAPNSIAKVTQITKVASRTVPATQDQQIEQSAQGRIKIINTYKETPQELIINTRFQAPNGLIYRIRESVEVPGYTMSGSAITPGTLEVTVYADSVGDEYNISNTTFTIPGFSGREQFEKITAETVGNITGGYIGIRKVVSEDTKATIEEDIKNELRTELEKNSDSASEHVLIPNLETITFSETKDEAQDSSVTLTISASVSAYSILKSDLFNFIGQNAVQGATSTDMFELEPSNLTYALTENGIQINGETTISWIIDVESIKNKFAGKKRSEIASIVDEYKSFEKLNIDLSPMWTSSFPEDPSKIVVRILE